MSVKSLYYFYRDFLNSVKCLKSVNVHTHITRVGYTIVNRGNWLWNPLNIKAANKEAQIYVGRSAKVHIFSFSLKHYAWIT